jgi:hypothetical protein
LLFWINLVPSITFFIFALKLFLSRFLDYVKSTFLNLGADSNCELSFCVVLGLFYTFSLLNVL